jgi:hypothetical protein
MENLHVHAFVIPQYRIIRRDMTCDICGKASEIKQMQSLSCIGGYTASYHKGTVCQKTAEEKAWRSVASFKDYESSIEDERGINKKIYSGMCDVPNCEQCKLTRCKHQKHGICVDCSDGYERDEI